MIVSIVEKFITDSLLKKIKESFSISEEDPILIKATTAIHKSIESFADKYGSYHGFLLKESNWDKIIDGFFYLTGDIDLESFDPSGNHDEKSATKEQISFFLDNLLNEFKKDRELEKIIAEKNHHNKTDKKLSDLKKSIDKNNISHIIGFIDKTSELIDKRQYKEALEILNLIKESNIWHDLSENEKFKVFKNIGNSLAGIGKYEEASAILFKSNVFKKVDKAKRDFNLSLSYFYKRDFKNAQTFAAAVIDDDPLNYKAINILINTTTTEDDFFEFFNELPPDITKNSDISLALANKFHEFKEFDKAIQWIDISIEQKQTPEKLEFKARIILLKIENSCNYKHYGTLNKEQKEDAQVALKDLENAWNLYRSEEEKRNHPECLIYKSFLLNMLDEKNKAKFIMDEAVKICSNRPDLLYSASQLYFFQGKIKESTNLLKRILSINPNEEIKILLLENYLNSDSKNNIDATELIEDIYKNKESSQDIIQKTKYLEVELQIIKKDFSAAEASALKIIKGCNSLRAWTSLIDSQIFQEKYVEAKKSCIDALSSQNNEPEPFKTSLRSKYADLIYSIAKKTNDNDLFEKAAEILEEITSKDIFTYNLYKLAHSYYLSGNKDKTLKICSDYREITKEINHDLAKLEINLLTDAEKIKEADILSVKYLEKHPDDRDVLMKKRWLDFRLERFEELDSFLDSIDTCEINKLDEIDINNILYYLKNRQKTSKYRCLLYEVCRIDSYKPKYAVPYCFGGYMDAINNKETTSTNDAIFLKIDGRGTQHFIVEDFERESPKPFEKHDKNEFAKSLINKKKGDKIPLRMEMGTPIMAEIVSFTSKYTHMGKQLYQEILNNPDIYGAKLFEMPEHADRFSILRKIYEAVGGGKRSKQVKEFENQYSVKKAIPFFLYSQAIGVDYIVNFLNTVKNRKIGFWTSFGDPKHLQNGMKNVKEALDSETPIIFDVYTLLFLFKLNDQSILEILKKSFYDIFVLKSLVSNIKEKLNSNIYLLERDLIEKFVNWINKNFTTVPVLEKLEKQPKDIEESRNFIGDDSYYPMIYAKNKNILFCSEDFITREVVAERFKLCSATWLEAIFNFLLLNKNISGEKYSELLSKLINMHYYPLFLTHINYLSLLIKDNFNVTESIKNSFFYLGEPVYTLEHAFNVSINLIFAINSLSIPEIKKSIIFDLTLNSFFYKRENREEIIKEINEKIEIYENSMLIKEKSLSKYFDTWQKNKLKI